ncbi:MAG TPA: hypothetical protein VFL77_11370 [Solirubrobacterales bacterium]|nr:hypothetical protein [Solirubrobacterales bacterium]
MRAVRSRLTYANVVATIALFLALSGGVVWAAHKVGTRALKPNAVTAGKIKKNAITAPKLHNNAVTGAKIRDDSIGLAKIAPGTNLVASAGGGPVGVNRDGETAIPLAGSTTFTSEAGVANLLSIEVRGANLGREGSEPCTPAVVPYINGNLYEMAPLTVSAFAPSAKEPSGLRPIAGATVPIGLLSPGTAQTVSLKVRGDIDCSAGSTVSVALAVTQAK